MGENTKPSIETERYLLRPITPDDLENWAKLIFADPDVMRYMPARDITPRERAERSYNFHNQTWENYDFGGWMVTDKHTGEILGDCYLEPEAGSGELEIGYTIGKTYWGKGAASEAGRAVVRFGFERGKVDRIVGVAMPDNVGSWRVLEKIGFVFEKNAHFYDLDVVVYAISPDDFNPGDHFYLVHED
jgi:ribosomal-protein-alanine N-acetyltransferase